MRTIFTPLVILLLVFPLLGFGCKKDPVIKPGTNYPVDAAYPVVRKPSTDKTAATVTSTQNKTQPVTAPTKKDPDITYLQKVMENFDAANSFRATLSIPIKDGTATGSVELSRATGLHGKLAMPTNITTEIYLVGSDIFFRANTSTWENLTNTEEGKQLAELFRIAFSVDGSGSTAIPDTAQIMGTGRDPSGCKLYVYTEPDRNGSNQICVKDDLPVRVVSQMDYGNVEVYYRDFNQPITITAPVKK